MGNSAADSVNACVLLVMHLCTHGCHAMAGTCDDMTVVAKRIMLGSLVKALGGLPDEETQKASNECV